MSYQFFVSFLAFVFSTVTFAQGPVEIHINTENKYQTIEGWGSSLCWWASEVGTWNDKKVDSIVHIITSPDLLNMNIFRFNIGGGDDPEHAGGHMAKGKGTRAEMEGYKDGPDKPYNWNADAGQRNILLKIKKSRPDAVFEAFSNSAPYWMTKSKCSAGFFKADEDNLDPSQYAAFTDYLLEVVQHYKTKYDIDFKTLEPFNESTSSYWYYKGSQEGCHFDAESQIEVLKILYPRLKKTGLKTIIAAPDETNLEATLKVLEAYKNQGEVFNWIGQINTHTYAGTNKQRRAVKKWVDSLQKPFWQSETGPSGGKYKNALENNLALAQKMFNDLKIMKPDAWLDWQLMEEHNATWCQMKADFNSEEFEIVKNLYVRMQVTRFIKQGYQIIDTDHKEVLAAISPNGDEVVSILLNKETGRDKKFKLKFDKMDTYSLAEVFRTSKNEDCKALDASGFSMDGIKAPALSLTTFIFRK
ncbi:glycoside hydrolase family 30 protein [Zunongwangia pacifica]|uniref:Glycoside hydrolase n=1 Tax=Zunongwangia pacifica TaxID=2911062 RepID=A0A9X2CNQ1_9FLAO|nr:glycoside hydrolase [Zunongwangia pacifica]MCL6220800.1 glycoside hydrolase [Zunongwangia pacifica]